jgi:hypothetical protein
VNEVISEVKLATQEGIEMIIIGVYVPFDNGSFIRYSEYYANLAYIGNIFDECEEQQILLMGDFNSDLERGRRFDIMLKAFIHEMKLTCLEYDFHDIHFIYTNNHYKSHIDHVIGNEKVRINTIKCYIFDDLINLSDHNPIHTIIQMNGFRLNEVKNVDEKIFYKFPWSSSEFVDR